MPLSQGALDIVMHAQGELREIKEELRSVRPERHGLVSELGDLLFNTILLVKVCERDEIGGVTLAGCAAFAAAKVQRRAPFVFVEGGSQTSKLSADQASNLWKAVKEQEKAGLVPVCPDGEIGCRLAQMMRACLVLNAELRHRAHPSCAPLQRATWFLFLQRVMVPCSVLHHTLFAFLSPHKIIVKFHLCIHRFTCMLVSLTIDSLSKDGGFWFV